MIDDVNVEDGVSAAFLVLVFNIAVIIAICVTTVYIISNTILRTVSSFITTTDNLEIDDLDLIEVVSVKEESC